MYGQERTGYGHQRDFTVREILEDVRRDKRQSSQVYSRCAAGARHPDLYRLFMIAHETEQAELREIGGYLERIGERVQPGAGAPEYDWGRPPQPRPGFYGPPGQPGQAAAGPGLTGNLPGAGVGPYGYSPGQTGVTRDPGGDLRATPAGETQDREQESND